MPKNLNMSSFKKLNHSKFIGNWKLGIENSHLRVLFLSRAFPPIIGGIENQNAGLVQYLVKQAEVKTIANTRGKKFLPFFIPYATIRALFLMRRYDALLLGDGVLGPLGAFVSIFYPQKTFVSVIHGLDVTYAKKKGFLSAIYRAINIPSLKLLDRLIMVGNETIEQAVSVGIDRKHCVFIPNGIDPDALYKHIDRSELDKLLGVSTKDKQVILRVGRFVRHKGVLWFLENVLPKLPEKYIFVGAGGVPEKKTAGDSNIYPLCQKAIKKLGLEKRAFLFPNIAQEDLVTLFNTCDLYVSPNIPVPGSLEGFGINLLEATSCEKVVLASNHEGLKDAIHEGKNGFLLPPADADAWIAKIQELGDKDADFLDTFGKNARVYTIENFSWDGIATRYVKEIKKLNRK